MEPLYRHFCLILPVDGEVCLDAVISENLRMGPSKTQFPSRPQTSRSTRHRRQISDPLLQPPVGQDNNDRPQSAPPRPNHSGPKHRHHLANQAPGRHSHRARLRLRRPPRPQGPPRPRPSVLAQTAQRKPHLRRRPQHRHQRRQHRTTSSSSTKPPSSRTKSTGRSRPSSAAPKAPSGLCRPRVARPASSTTSGTTPTRVGTVSCQPSRTARTSIRTSWKCKNEPTPSSTARTSSANSSNRPTAWSAANSFARFFVKISRTNPDSRLAQPHRPNPNPIFQNRIYKTAAANPAGTAPILPEASG